MDVGGAAPSGAAKERQPSDEQPRAGSARVQLAILQATPFCNINCDYCYLPARSLNRRMRPETLSKISERLFESPFIGDELTVVWHAGEPLVVPIAFYENAYGIFQRHNQGRTRVVFSFQTNAMLVTKAWCDFFLKIGARVGVSIDGPKQIHDLHRVDRSGRGTFDRAMRGLGLLQAAGLGPSMIMVLTRDSLDHPDDIWKFLIRNSVDLVGFNPEEAEGINLSSSVHDDESERRYHRFLMQFLHLSDPPNGRPRLREYESTASVLRSTSEEVSAHDNVPMAIISFDCDGNISTFSPELLTTSHPMFGSFTFGNVFQQSLADVLENGKFRGVNAPIQEGVRRCRMTCDYYGFCGGGSPSNKIVEAGTFTATETRSCRLRIKVTVSAIADHLERQASQVGNRPQPVWPKPR